jgi:uncharacterized membrane protein HdeD (DUF308 family)
MEGALKHGWWALLIRGIAAIIFGALCFAMPGVTIRVLIWLFGAFALVDGVFGLIAYLQAKKAGEDHGGLLFEALVGIAVGLAVLFWPGLTAVVLLYFIGGWAIMRGIFEIVAAVKLRKVIKGEFWMILGGIVSVLFGITLFARPGVGALAVIWIIGVYAIIFGIVLVGLAFVAKKLGKEITSATEAA